MTLCEDLVQQGVVFAQLNQSSKRLIQYLLPTQTCRRVCIRLELDLNSFHCGRDLSNVGLM